MTFLLLEAENKWRLGDWREQPAEPTVAVGELLSLTAARDGPLSFRAPDGSLGRLRLPRWLALGDKSAGYTLYLLAADGGRILRFDRWRCKFVRLPGIGGRRDAVRGLYNPTAIALTGRSLYVADAERVRIFDTATLALLEIFRLPGEGVLDLAAHAGWVYIMTASRVYRHRPGASRLQMIPEAKAGAGGWRNILVNRAGELLLYNGAELKRYDERGRCQDYVADPGDVRGEFDPPALYADHHQPARFFVPPELADPRQPRLPAVPITPESELWARALRQPDSLFFDLSDGSRVLAESDLSVIDESPRPALYEPKGVWLSAPLDSRQYHCPWHTVEVELDALPRGSQLTLATYTGDTSANTYQVQNSQWDKSGRLIGEGDGAVKQKFLVQSRPGRFLRVRLELCGDGRASPLVRRLKIEYPRDSYLNYLPAEYLRNEASRQFLEHFLAIVQSVWDDIEAKTADFATLADPRAVPEGERLEYLAAWLALPLEGRWTGEQKRRLLVAAPAILAQHGTLAGLHAYLQVYLHNMTGLTPAQQRAYPVIIEGYRRRERATLPAGETLRFGLPLWTPSVVRRLQLDVYATEGEVELVSSGDPQRDLFHMYAHRFRVIVPAVWLRDEEDERMLRRAIESAKPAHTAYELVLVPSQMVVGIQSTLDVDTILGDRPPAQLGRGAFGTTVLAGSGADEAVRLGPGLQLG